MKNVRTKTVLLLAITALTATLIVTQSNAMGKDKKAEKILKNYVSAIGGEMAVNNIGNLVTASELIFTETGLTVKKEIVSDKANRYYCKATAPGMGEMLKGFDGNACWELYPSGLRKIGENEKRKFLNESAFLRYSKWADILESYKYLGMVKIDDTELQKVSVTTIYGLDETWYFNKANGLLSRMEEQMETPQGKVNVVTTFEDYREIDGVKHSFVQYIIMPGKTNKIVYTNIRQNQHFDDTIFTVPAGNNP